MARSQKLFMLRSLVARSSYEFARNMILARFESTTRSACSLRRLSKGSQLLTCCLLSCTSQPWRRPELQSARPSWPAFAPRSRSSELCRPGTVFTVRSPASAKHWRLGASSVISHLEQCDQVGFSWADGLLSFARAQLDLRFAASTSCCTLRLRYSVQNRHVAWKLQASELPLWSQSGLPSRQ